MGSNIAIEASYLRGNKSSFSSLVSNIKGIVEKLNTNLDNIIEMLIKSERIIYLLRHSGITK